jgi:hypothetical protein
MMNTLRLLPVVLAAGMLALVIASLTACATAPASPDAANPVRAPEGVPDKFKAPTSAGRVELGPEAVCLNPLIDPRDETRLTLVRSTGGHGDYAPEPLRYGVQEGELLRVDCATGQAVGIVKR